MKTYISIILCALLFIMTGCATYTTHADIVVSNQQGEIIDVFNNVKLRGVTQSSNDVILIKEQNGFIHFHDEDGVLHSVKTGANMVSVNYRSQVYNKPSYYKEKDLSNMPQRYRWKELHHINATTYIEYDPVEDVYHVYYPFKLCMTKPMSYDRLIEFIQDRPSIKEEHKKRAFDKLAEHRASL